MDVHSHKPAHLPEESLPAAGAKRTAGFGHIEDLRHPAIVRTDSITEACQIHASPDIRITYQPELAIPRLAELESFTAERNLGNSRAERFFSFKDAPAASYEPALREALQNLEGADPSLLNEFASFTTDLVHEFVVARGLEAGGFLSDMAILKMGEKPLWHLDSFDPNKEKLQLIIVVAGNAGSMLTTGDEYDSAEFKRHRDLLYSMETHLIQQKEQITQLGGDAAWNAQRGSIEQAQQMVSEGVIKSLRTLVPENAGVTTDPQTVLIFKAGEGLHANGSAPGNRLIFALSEA